jgi:hypothetical protein
VTGRRTAGFWAGVGVAVVGLLGLSACGSASGTAASPPEAAGRPLSAVLSGVYRTTVATGSAQFELSITVKVGGRQITESGSGDVDWGTQDGNLDLTVSLPGASGATTSERLSEVISDGNEYVKSPTVLGGGKTWIETSLGSGSSGSSVGTDPAGYLALLESKATGLTDLGPATVGDTATTEYRAEVDPTKVVAEASPAVRRLVARADALAGVSTVPITLWVDGQGRARQLAEHVTTTPPAASPLSGSGPIETALTMTISGYGQPVSVVVPPASEVTSVPLSKLLGGL